MTISRATTLLSIGGTRARMTVRGAAVGFAGRRSHDIVDVERCIALDPTLDAAMQAGRRALGALIGEEGALSGLVREGAVELAVTSGRGVDRARLQAAAGALVGQAAIARITVDDSNAPAAGFLRKGGMVEVWIEPEQREREAVLSTCFAMA